LSADEQDALLAAYQPDLDCQAPTCSYDAKLARMQAWLATKGVSISEAEARASRSKAS
jgi:hypothetical protein